MNNDEQAEVTLQDILQGIKDTETAIMNGNDSVDKLEQSMTHLSGQLDILNHSMGLGNQYLSWITISIMCIAAMLMFLAGYILSRR